MYYLSIPNAHAQNVPRSQAPIQRTIEEVNSDGVLASEVTPRQESQSNSQKGVLLGLGAILLILIAVVAVVKLWQNNLSQELRSASPNLNPVAKPAAKPRPKRVVKKTSPKVSSTSRKM